MRDLASVPPRPGLSELSRFRICRELRALYAPLVDEPLGPRFAELVRRLEASLG